MDEQLLARMAELKQDLREGLIDEATYKRLMAKLSQEEPRITDQSVGDGAAKAESGGVAVAQFGQYIHGNVYHGPKTSIPEEALHIYRQVVLRQTGNLSQLGLDKSAADASNYDQPLHLANVYVSLNTTRRIMDPALQLLKQDDTRKSPFGEDLDKRINRSLMPYSVLRACREKQRLILLGDPGSGKSTFVNHLAHGLVAHQLGLGSYWKSRLCDFRTGLAEEQLDLLPILITLRDFVGSLPDSLPQGSDAPFNELAGFIEKKLQIQRLQFAQIPIFNLLNDGQVIVLLDGLDEVTNVTQRRFVRDAVSQFEQAYPNCSYLITCRILSYQPPLEGEQKNDLRLNKQRFPTLELAPFDEKQRDQFVDSWYEELVNNGKLINTVKAKGDAKRLKSSIRRTDLWKLAGNPLLLTIMALVHTDNKQLPDGRAELYNETIKVLLWRWDSIKQTGDDLPPLKKLLSEANRNELELIQAMSSVAFAIHGKKNNANSQGNSEIVMHKLYQALSSLNNDHGWIAQVVSLMKERAGLLVERVPGIFAFPHRTFQEYLAGVYLANSYDSEGEPDFHKQAANLAHLPEWRTAILLAVGYLTHVKPEKFRILALLDEITEERGNNDNIWRKSWLAGDVILEMGQSRIESIPKGAISLQNVKNRLINLVDKGVLTKRERLALGQTLGNIGDTRRGVGINDEGFPDIAWGKQVPKGNYIIGGDKEVQKLAKTHKITVRRPYQLAKYPVTVAQFQSFVDAPDYHHVDWWSNMPYSANNYLGKPLVTKHIHDPFVSISNHPRDMVSWYQAVAFCRWLGDKLGYHIGLPHEYEWEIAARFNDQRDFSWGNVLDPSKANTGREMNQTTAVGLYPNGYQNILGLFDLSGNVWEWCKNTWDNVDGVQVDSSGYRRSLRGGAWDINLDYARSAYRFAEHPQVCSANIGFRLRRYV